MTTAPNPQALDPTQTKGRVIHWAFGYDLLVWLFFLGRERAFRRRVVQLARLDAGQAVLDVGCGTGSLAIAAKQAVGPAGAVEGIDPSAAMIARARKKARKAGMNVALRQGVIEALPFPDARFDTVLSTLMLHHLPGALRAQGVREMRRVVRPGGRVLVVEFGRARERSKGLIDHLHRHGGLDPDDLTALMRDASLEIVERGTLRIRNMYYLLATPRNGS